MDPYTIGSVRLTTLEAEAVVGKMGHLFTEVMSHGLSASELGKYWGGVTEDWQKGRLLLPKADVMVMENIFRFFWSFFEASAASK